MAQRYNRLSLLLVFLLTGCNRYEVTFNQQPIHTPAKLLTGYEIEDPVLRSCVAQTIQDQRISRIDALKRLLCTNAGIGSLKGLEAFVGLETLNLANNALSTIEPLHILPSLTQLDLSANPSLKCNEIDALTARGVTTTIPDHCKQRPTR